MRGRKPIPTKIKILRGNPGKRPLRDDEPEPKTANLEDPPEWIGKYGKAEWRRVVSSMPADVITGVDIAAFEMYCYTWNEFREAALVVKRKGQTVTTPGGLVQVRPEMSIMRNARKEALRIAVELGITPSARSRVHVAVSTGEKKPGETRRTIAEDIGLA